MNFNRFGLACGVAAGVFYTACILTMSVAGRESLIFFFNSVFHGLDVSSILRREVSVFDSLFGLVNIMAIGWVFGALVATLYNFSPRAGIPTETAKLKTD